MAVSLGRPSTGLKNARPLTRKEATLTDLPRWVEVAVEPKTGRIVFTNAWLPTFKARNDAADTLESFWD